MDRMGRWTINAGGVAIIASVLGIFVFIMVEVWPLLESPQVGPAEVVEWAAPGVGAVIVDEHRSHVAGLSRDGTVKVLRLADGVEVLERRLLEDPAVQGGDGEKPARETGFARLGALSGRDVLAGATRDGRVIAVRTDWSVSFEGRNRVITPEVSEPVIFEVDGDGRTPEAFAVRMDPDGAGAAAAAFADRSVRLVTRSVRENLLTGEITESFRTSSFTSPRRLSRLLLDGAGANLFGATGSGEILWWKLEGGAPAEPEIVSAGARAITAMTLLIGDRALVVGQEDGSLSIWFPVREAEGFFTLQRVRDFPVHPGAVGLLAPSHRNKSFIAQDATGMLGLYHSTSHRVLWKGPSPLGEARAMAFGPKADGVILASGDAVADVEVDNPHPEAGLDAFFGRVWYEGYERPELVWQSSSATDDFEPKLSLVPLAVGTLKGTIYSLILAVPLGVLGAMYTSQFMPPSLQRYVKPAVEIMAALPSVVIGFIAGLWLAPRVERIIPSLLLMAAIVPAAVIGAGLIWDRVCRLMRGELPRGSEVVMLMAVTAAAVWASILLGPSLEAAAFGGDFQQWLLETTGLRYDQRNAIVVGLAMGFAVIPIIFAISEDSFSNVPKSIISGSLALGADRWQTVTRVVLPMASPGIFSAIMIGFGRAVGETMIVLMATGNTPVLDWNPFNGFRTLSANIAVEIPEAPHGDTLYRTLFLAGLLLFVITFVMNTAAELVRGRLRRKYSQL